MEEARAAKKDKWVKDNLGQLLVAAARVAWAGECEKALVDPQGARGALGALCKRWDALLARLAAHARASLSDVERAKARRRPPAVPPYWAPGRAALTLTLHLALHRWLRC